MCWSERREAISYLPQNRFGYISIFFFSFPLEMMRTVPTWKESGQLTLRKGLFSMTHLKTRKLLTSLSILIYLANSGLSHASNAIQEESNGLFQKSGNIISGIAKYALGGLVYDTYANHKTAIAHGITTYGPQAAHLLCEYGAKSANGIGTAALYAYDVAASIAPTIYSAAVCGYASLQETVKENPIISIGVAFSVGMLAARWWFGSSNKQSAAPSTAVQELRQELNTAAHADATSTNTNTQGVTVNNVQAQPLVILVPNK